MPNRGFRLVEFISSSNLSLILFVSIDETSPTARACASSALEECTLRWFRGFIVVLLSSAAYAEENGCDEVASERGPFESESVIANVGRLTIVSEMVATLHISSTVRR